MSVAFRRESDEEHNEPRFELPIPPGPNLVTARGLAQIESKVIALEARIDGADPESKEELERDLRYWRTRRATAELMPPSTSTEVAFGSHVRFTLRGSPRAIDIVGDDEADPASGRIAFSAPLARAMMGYCAGDLLDFGGEADAIEIVEVAPIDLDR